MNHPEEAAHNRERMTRELQCAACGATVGAIVGAIAGPAGAVAGAVIGAAAGTVAEIGMEAEHDRREARIAELDAYPPADSLRSRPGAQPEPPEASPAEGRTVPRP